MRNIRLLSRYGPERAIYVSLVICDCVLFEICLIAIIDDRHEKLYRNTYIHLILTVVTCLF